MPKSDINLEAMFKTTEGRVRFADALVKGVNYQNITRTVLRIDKVPAGQAAAIYDNAEGGRTQVEDSEFADHISFRLAALKRMFDQGGEAFSAAIFKQFTIPQQEDELLFESLKTLEQRTLMYKDEEALQCCFPQMMTYLEEKDLKAKYFVANPRLCSYIKTIHDVDILRSDLCDVNEVYIFPEKEFSGVFAIRNDLQCVPADNPEAITVGFVFFELAGLYVDKAKVLRFNLNRRQYKNKFEFFQATWKDENETITA